MAFTEVAKLFASGQLRFENGKIALLDEKVSMIPLDFIVTLQKISEEDRNPNLVYYCAKESGVRWFKGMYEHFKISPEEVTRWGVNVLSVAGWGQSEVTRLDSKEEIMQVKLIGGTQGATYGMSKRAVDCFVRGCYASGAKVLFGKDCDCIETSCISQGAPFCEFVAKPTTEFDLENPIVKQQLSKK